MKKAVSIFLALVMGLSLVACGSTPSSTAAPASEPASTTTSTPASEPTEKVTVNVAYMTDFASLAGVVSAIKLGAFEEEGIEVTLAEFGDGPTIINAMESGSIDIGYIGQGAHKLCVGGRAKIFALANISNADAVIGSKSKGTDTLENLKGKTVAYASGTSSEDILRMGLEKAGLTMDDITPMDMNMSNLVTAMLSGGVDACAASAPSTTTILNEMGDDGLTLCDNMTFADQTVFLSSWICMPDYAEQNSELLVKFARALYKGFDYRADPANNDEVCGWIADMCKLDKDTLLTQVDVGEWTTSEFVRDNMDTVKEYYQIQQDNLVANGDCEVTPLEDYILFDVMEQACA